MITMTGGWLIATTAAMLAFMDCGGFQQTDSVSELRSTASKAFAAGRYEEAFDKAAEICRLAPDDIDHQFFLGEAGFAAGRIDECIAAFDAVIRLDPSTEPQLWQRGLALYYADRFADGVKQFEQHQKVNTQDVFGHRDFKPTM